MEYICGLRKQETVEIQDILEGGEACGLVKVNGSVHRIRDMGDLAFLILRKADGLLQCLCESPKTFPGFEGLKEESAVEITGEVFREERALHGLEIHVKEIRVLSSPYAPLPVPVGKRKMDTSLETKMALRPLVLRNPLERSKFKIQDGIARGFREFLRGQGFTEIRTPKIVARGAEGGANVFRLDYFNKKAELAQSPQLYKQMMVGVFDRVFETAPVFRAEKHHTVRHLNEYVSLDLEMGYIRDFGDVMEMEAEMLRHIMGLLREEYAGELKLWKVELPDVDKIPVVRFDEAKELASQKYNRPIKNPYDLEPEEESLIGRYFKEECQSDFVFVTHYPSKKRPFYAKDDPSDPKYTLSFDLLFRGMEVTTGGQRIHDYLELTEKMEKRGMKPEGLEHYLMIFKHGMPPHGGLGIGLERLTMNLLGLKNVRETSLFPRDIARLEP